MWGGGGGGAAGDWGAEQNSSECHTSVALDTSTEKPTRKVRTSKIGGSRPALQDGSLWAGSTRHTTADYANQMEHALTAMPLSRLAGEAGGH